MKYIPLRRIRSDYHERGDHTFEGTSRVRYRVYRTILNRGKYNKEEPWRD